VKKYQEAKKRLAALIALSILGAALLSSCSSSTEMISSGGATQSSSMAVDVIRDMSEELANPNTVGNTSGNMSNYGFAAEQAGWIYYAAQGAIFRIEDGSDDLSAAEEVYSGNQPMCLNIIGKDLFFRDSGELQHLDLETGALETLYSPNGLYNNRGVIWLENGMLYYIEERPTSASSKEYRLMQRAADAPAEEVGECIYASEKSLDCILGTVDGYLYLAKANGVEYTGHDVVGVSLSTGEVRDIYAEPWATPIDDNRRPHIRNFLIEDGKLYGLCNLGEGIAGNSSIVIYDLVQQQVVRGFVKDWEYGATFNQFDGRFLVSMSHVGMALCQPGDQSGPIVNEDYAGNVCTAGDYIFYTLMENGGFSLHAVKGDGSCYQRIGEISL